MEIKNVKNIIGDLSKFDYLCNKNDNEFISITEWSNREGWDISINGKDENTMFSLTRGKLDAINYLTRKLEYESDIESNE